MGLYIKGIDMPIECGNCDFFREDYGHPYCFITEKHITFIGEIADFCPLIEIPTPHGRLIAEGSITDQLQEIEDITALSHIDLGEEPYDDTDEIMLPISTIRKILDRCITILEAEPQ